MREQQQGPGRCNQYESDRRGDSHCVCGLQASHCSCWEGVQSRFCPASDKLKSTAQAMYGLYCVDTCTLPLASSLFGTAFIVLYYLVRSFMKASEAG